MKKQFTKAIAVVAMAFLANASALAQGQGGHSHVTVASNTKGADWEIFHFPRINPNTGDLQTGADGKTYYDRHYYYGDHFNDMTVNKFPGTHWKGHTLDDLGSSGQFYLCNVQTGEYLQIGDYWGSNTMTNHAGIPFNLAAATNSRKAANWNEFKDDETAAGYWLCVNLDNQDDSRQKYVGRLHAGDGQQGNYEHNRYLALRYDIEYHEPDYIRPTNWSEHPGGFVFWFEPVTTSDGKQAYVIYTHRQTQAVGHNNDRAEFWDRDSYLLLRSQDRTNVGYHTVRWKKFAGQMYGKPGAASSGTATLANVSTTTTEFGTYSNGNDYSPTFTTTAASGFAGITLTADGNYLKPIFVNESYGHVISFLPTDQEWHTITVTAPEGYIITASDINVRLETRNCKYYVEGDSEGSPTLFDAPNDFTLTPSGLGTGTITLRLKKHENGIDDKPVYFRKFSLTLEKVNETGASWPEYIAEYIGSDADKNAPIEDEVEFYNDGKKYVSFKDGVKEAKKDDANLWKIVTKEERERFRLVASEDQPVDMSYRIKNNKFYTSYTYTRSVGDEGVTWDGTYNHYTHANGERDFGWQWFDVDRETHFTTHHIHPWNQHKVSNPGWFDVSKLEGNVVVDENVPRSRELHKIGTGYYHRFNSKYYDDKQQENYLTFGVEANYVGSIWKGNTNLQQKITGLREGLYVVAVKAFYAPHDMQKYFKEDGEVYNHKSSDFSTDVFTTSQLATDNQWYKEAVVTDDATNDVNKNDNGKWKRSHDSYLFAWSRPKGENKEEVRRMLPSIYEGAVNWDELNESEKKLLSNEYLLDDPNFKYTELGDRGLRNVQGENSDGSKFNYKDLFNHLKDSLNIAIYDGAHFSASRYEGWNYNSGNWAVPKSLFAAGHWFNALEAIMDPTTADDYPHLQNLKAYRIALPVYVGSDGNLIIGIDHTLVNQELEFNYEYVDGEGNTQSASRTIPKSNPDEWVCFDDFELIYLGKVEPDEFVIDERNGSSDYMVASRVKTNGTTGEAVADEAHATDEQYSNGKADVPNQNNTQWHDIFSENDISLYGKNSTTVKNVLIRRTLTKDGYSSIVVPVDLTYAQVKEGFGEDVRVSQLSDFTGRTIVYKAMEIDENGDPIADDAILMKAGVPYIIKPSKDPDVPAPTVDNNGEKKIEVTYDRPKFSLAYSASAPDIAGFYLRDEKRNYEVETKMEGPIYVINDVTIKSNTTFPAVEMEPYTGEGGKTLWQRKSAGSIEQDLADNAVWAEIDAFDSKVKLGKTYAIHNRPEVKGKKYILRETAHYEAGVDIPAHSYLWAAGKMYYTSSPVPTSRGLYSYLQMVEVNDEGTPTGAFYAKPFIGGTDTFIEIIEDPSVTGIEDVNKRVDPDGKLEIYDLMGRKVTNPRPGTIYIMNGIKVMWK
ncbi:MAG: hypothetical protein IJ605_06300 [Prevotella sp.]|nr:hypothetical protein [Prevotella sp.]